MFKILTAEIIGGIIGLVLGFIFLISGGRFYSSKYGLIGVILSIVIGIAIVIKII